VCRAESDDTAHESISTRVGISCAVIIDNPDGTSHTSPTCIVPAASFDGKSIRTVEGHAKNGELTSLQKAFIEHFAFQCGYCTAGFLNESQVLLERLARTPIARADLEKTIAEALDGHLLPLHRLRQISRGGARRDPGGSNAIPPKQLKMTIDLQIPLFIVA